MSVDTPLFTVARDPSNLNAEGVDAAAPDSAPQPDASGPALRILLVDDAPSHAQVLRKTLGATWHVLHASTEGAALDIARTRTPDLILLDVDTPAIDGSRICGALKAESGTRNIPVMFISSASSPEDEARCLSMGAADLISKPVNPPVLLTRVRTQLRLATAARALKQHAQSLQLAANVFASTHEGIVIADARWRIVNVNHAFRTITGHQAQAILGSDLYALLGFDLPVARADIVREIEKSGFWAAEVSSVDSGGRVFAKLATIRVMRDTRGAVTHYISVFTDISEVKRQQYRLERLAHYDALTDVANRALLAQTIERAAQRVETQGGSFAVLYIDLDGFKDVNDRHGHELGDQVLKGLAGRMRENLRESDTLARMGGDEFVIIVDPAPEVAELESFANKVIGMIRQPIRIDAHELSISASLGITRFPQDHVQPEQLLRHADHAMYEAKRAGKATYHVFNAAIESEHSKRAILQAQVRHAIEDGQIVLHYQPKVMLRTGRILGFEALARWNHPSLGLLGPDNFLPCVQGTSLGLRLGYCVIEMALAELGRWRVQGASYTVSVNVDAHHLLDEDFLPRIRTILDAHPDLRPGDLKLEILESSAVEDPHAVSRAMHACMALGIEFSLDDFGRAYSTLDHLRHLPAGEVKIDKSFVHDIGDDRDGQAIVRGIVSLAQAFARDVIAEGIETAHHG